MSPVFFSWRAGKVAPFRVSRRLLKASNLKLEVKT